MGGRINVGDLQEAVSKLMGEYAEGVYKATESGLEAAEQVMIERLKSASPVNAKLSRRGFAKNWKSTGKRYKLARYIHNTTMVEGKSGPIPLSNILEFSTVRGHPFIQRTVDAAVGQAAQAIVDSVKNAK